MKNAVAPEFVLYCRGVVLHHVTDKTYQQAMDLASAEAKMHGQPVDVKALLRIGRVEPRAAPSS